MAHELNERPRPRVLVVIQSAWTRHTLEELLTWPGSYEIVEAVPHVDWDEYDAVITDLAPLRSRGQSVPSHRWIRTGIPVFLILAHPMGAQGSLDQGIAEGWGEGWLRRRSELGRRIAIDDTVLEPAVAALARGPLTEDLRKRPSQWGVELSETSSGSLSLSPILSGPNNLVLAGTYDRGDGIENWIVPEDTEPVPWIRLALESWQRQMPAQFPSLPEWHHAEPWLSAAERAANRALETAEADFAEARSTYEIVRTRVQTELAAARQAADSGSRRLLTSSGIELEDAVAEALLELGFAVRRMDNEIADAKHEDLQVRHEQWTAVVEVTGTRRGVPQAKWARLTGHLTHYLRQPDSDRSAVPWLVVNQHIDLPPAARQPLWNPDFLSVIEEAGGTAVESPALFLLTEAVRTGRAAREDVVRYLKSCIGVLDIDGAQRFLNAAPNSAPAEQASEQQRGQGG